MSRTILTTAEVDAALAADSPVAIGVSGGKDSSAVALATIVYLDSVGHKGPRLLVHSDLGRVEWKDSLPSCERLAKKLGLELLVVRRQAGDMLARWEGRWKANLERYQELSCVKVILPWSTPAMRFCTSELKTDIICRALVKRFPGRTILSVTGIRREESSNRAKSPIATPQAKLKSATHKTIGFNWNPILDWTLEDVLAFHRENGHELHEAYTVYGSSRVSCAFCILGSKADLKASASCPDNANVYRAMVDLELESTFAFQGDAWLCDTAPHLLTLEQKKRVPLAKAAAEKRREAEARIPSHLLYEKGWPKSVPSLAEAELLAGIRRDVAKILGVKPTFATAAEIVARYRELMAEKAA